MPEFRFLVEGLQPAPRALAPALRMGLRVVNGSPEPVEAIWLRCTVQIEPALRGYSAAEAARLAGLFGSPERWSETLRPFLWQEVAVMVPGFTGTTVCELLLPCSLDVALAGSQYCESLAGGHVPLRLLFSGVVLLRGPSGVQAAPIPWEIEARYRMPAAAWQAALDAVWPERRWLGLTPEVFARLLAFRAAGGHASWEQTLEALLAPAAARQEAA
jgi:hypothetical protein